MRGTRGTMQVKKTNLDWVPEFILRVKSYIFVRLEDNILIKRPNQAVQLNESGAWILYQLLNGRTMVELLKAIGADKEKVAEINLFLRAVKDHLQGTLCEFSTNPAVIKETFSESINKLPVLSEIAITYKCNLKCQFCYAGCSRNSATHDPQRELPPPGDIEALLEKIYYQAKVPSVSFTGGEPTLHPYLNRFIRFAKKLGMRVNLISNGSKITEDFAKQLSDSGLDSAQISLEGTQQHIHETITQTDGSFVDTLAGIRHLNNQAIPTHTNTTINRLNILDCPSVPKFIKEELTGKRFSMNLMIPAGSGRENLRHQVFYAEIGDTLQQLIHNSEEHDVEFMWYSPVPMCLFNSVAHNLGNKGCSACDGLLSLAPNGDVLPCSSLADPVGNLLKQDFDAIWQNRQASKYRCKGFSHPGCQECEEFAICNGACPIYWQQMGFQEIIPTLENRGLVQGAN